MPSLLILPAIETQRLHLRILAHDDAASFHALTDEPAIIDAVDFLRSPFTLAEAEALIRGGGDGRDCFWGLWPKTDDALDLEALDHEALDHEAPDHEAPGHRQSDSMNVTGSHDLKRDLGGASGFLFRSSALIGTVGSHLRGSDEIEIGYWLASAMQGRGLASEAVTAVIEALTQAFPARRIYAECRPQNRASWHLLEKIGFRPDGAGKRAGRMKLVLARAPT